MNEIWKTTTVNEDYEVSNLGNVRSHKSSNACLLKPFKRGVQKDGGGEKGYYLSVRLLSNGQAKDYSVHRLVALAFLPNPKQLPQINHINGKRNDNRVENLEWCDGSYNTWHSYNILGNKNGTERAVKQYRKDGAFIREYESTIVASKKTNICPSSITEVCQRRGYRKTAGGFIWRYKGDEDIILKYERTSPVVQISKYGEKLKVFDSVRDAAIKVGVAEGGISGVCLMKKRGYNYAGGYLWRYEDDYDEEEFGYYLDKTFIQMTYNNIFVAEYKGAHELVDKSGCELVKVIMCCRGERNGTNGFKWCIKEELDLTRESRREKPVVQLGKDFEYLSEYTSVVQASKVNSVHATHIGNSCKTKGKRTTGGYRWMYKEEYIDYIKQKKQKNGA